MKTQLTKEDQILFLMSLFAIEDLINQGKMSRKTVTKALLSKRLLSRHYIKKLYSPEVHGDMPNDSEQ